MTLARSELSHGVARLGRHAALIVGGGAIAYAGLLLAIVAALVLGLIRLRITPWAAALVGGIAVLALGYLLVQQTVHDATVGKVTTMINTVTEKVGDVGGQMQDQAQYAASYVRENPIPALLIGAGVTWLLLRSRGNDRYAISAPLGDDASAASGESDSRTTGASRGSMTTGAGRS